MTNADKIRAMTDEELLHLFITRYDGEPVFTCPASCEIVGKCGFTSDCDKCLSDWLKAEAEEV